MDRYEIYALCDPITAEIRYIGKANDSAKRLVRHMRDRIRRDYPVYRWINKLVENGLMPMLIVLEVTDDWRAAERRLIALSRARGVRLLNVAEGGDQPHCPPEVRAKNARQNYAARLECPFKFTRHRFMQHVGFVIRDLKKSKADQAARLQKRMDHLKRLDAETLFWILFERPSFHFLLPDYVRQDAKAFCEGRLEVAA